MDIIFSTDISKTLSARVAVIDNQYYPYIFNYLTGQITGNIKLAFAKQTPNGVKYVSKRGYPKQYALTIARRWASKN